MISAYDPLAAIFGPGSVITSSTDKTGMALSPGMGVVAAIDMSAMKPERPDLPSNIEAKNGIPWASAHFSGAVANSTMVSKPVLSDPNNGLRIDYSGGPLQK